MFFACRHFLTSRTICSFLSACVFVLLFPYLLASRVSLSCECVCFNFFTGLAAVALDSPDPMTLEVRSLRCYSSHEFAFQNTPRRLRSRSFRPDRLYPCYCRSHHRYILDTFGISYLSNYFFPSVFSSANNINSIITPAILRFGHE